MTADTDTAPAWELRRPDLLLAALAARHAFDRPRTLLARVDGPYEEQRMVDSTVLWDEPVEDEMERTRMTEQALQRLGLGRSRRPYRECPVVTAVVVRPGSSWFAWDEREVWLGLRYGSNLCDVILGDIITVTAQGWLSQLDALSGTSPSAVWAGDAAEASSAIRPGGAG